MSKTNTPTEREFFDAVGRGQIDEVRRLVQTSPLLLQGYDYSSFGATPVTRVCLQGDPTMLAMLIELNADLDRRSDWEMGPWSPLHCAVFKRDTDLANYLLDNGATLDVHSAAGLGRADDVARMINASPERVCELGGDGCQPLHFADSSDVAQLLLDRGADIDARCVDHFSTPVQYLSAARPEVARFLFTVGAKADIFSAIMANDVTVVQRLVDADPSVLNARVDQTYFPPGPDPNVHNMMTFTVGQDCTPMHAAAKADLPSMVSFLADAGLSPNVRGGYDDAGPLHIAAWNDCCHAAEALLRHGADTDMRSGSIHNNSPAGWAIVSGSANVFDLLMDAGANVFDWFHGDAQKAMDGAFREYKCVPQQNYERILARLQGAC